MFLEDFAISHRGIARAARVMYGEDTDKIPGPKPEWIKKIFEKARRAAYMSDMEYGNCKWPDKHMALLEYIMRSNYMPSEKAAIKLARSVYNVRRLDIPRTLTYTNPQVVGRSNVVQDYPQIYGDLLALTKDFNVTTSQRHSRISFTTRGDIKLTDRMGRLHNLGKYVIVLDRSSSWRSYRVLSVDGKRHFNESHCCHPHVRLGKMCEGDASRALNGFRDANALYEFIHTIKTALSTYNPDSPHASLETWTGHSCIFCEYVSTNEANVISCASCGVSACHGCVVRCQTCNRRVCPHCRPKETRAVRDIRSNGWSTAECCACCRSVCSGCRNLYHNGLLSCPMNCSESGYCGDCTTDKLVWFPRSESEGPVHPGYMEEWEEGVRLGELELPNKMCKNCAVLFTECCRKIMDISRPDNFNRMFDSNAGCASSFATDDPGQSQLGSIYDRAISILPEMGRKAAHYIGRGDEVLQR